MAKTKVPKRIGGVKLPKKVRKQAKKAIKLVESPVRDFAVSGLTAAAEALAQRTASDLRAAGQTQRKASLAALDLGDMLREAAIEGARRFLEGFEEARATAARPARASTGVTRRPATARKAKAAAKPAAKKSGAPKPKTATKPTTKTTGKAKTASKPRPAKPAARPRKPTGRAGRSGGAPAAGG